MRSPSNRGPGPRPGAGCEGGFTLLEALVALVVLGLALATCIQGFALALRAQAQSRAHLEAVALTDARMEALALLPPDSLLRYREAQDGSFAPPFERYRWRALLRADSTNPSLVGAAVRVEWEGGSYDLETILYRADPLPLR